MRPLLALWAIGFGSGCGSNDPGAAPSAASDASQIGPEAETEASAAVDTDVADVTSVDGGAFEGSPIADGSNEAEVGTTPDIPGWNLVWRDEFDGPAGAPADPSKWGYAAGLSPVDHEVAYYTDRPENSGLDGFGNLSITVLHEPYMGSEYTSARLETSGGKFEQAYGRFEARMRLPTGKGLAPGFFAFGNDMEQVGWPSCGEIDIMQVRGSEPTINQGSLRGPGYSGVDDLTTRYFLTSGRSFVQDFHRFAVEWEEGVVRFYVDSDIYQTRYASDMKGDEMRWVIDHPMYLVLGVAVGGAFSGDPDATTTFPQTMLVDYVRVYSR